MTHGTEFHGRGSAPAHPGRHRLDGADGGWTPPLAQNRAGRRHAAGPAPVDPPVSGSLPLAQPRSGTHPLAQPRSGAFPLPQPTSGALPLAQPISGAFPLPPSTSGALPLPQPTSGAFPLPQPTSGALPQPSLPQPRDRRPAAPLFPASHGSLPLDGDVEPDEHVEPDEPPRPETRADLAARRTRVSLVTPQPRGVDPEDDDVRIYAAPPIDGLGGFTIGSVPASVTPPKTWRKAAWFATGASGAVVVGLLFAGSYLVGKPVDQAVQGAWPGYQGAPTVIDPTAEAEPPSRQGGSAPGPDDSTPSPDKPAGRTRGGGAGPVDGVPTPPVTDNPAGSKTSGTATPSGWPQKPPVTPAQRETPVKPPWWYSFPPDAQTMGDNSEKFFNTVTTDPAAASSVTTGDLHDRGPQALADRYAGVAYFEVRKISVDQQRGVTVNTVEITHTDGSKTIEERTLTFGDGDKIAADGQ